jgi:hypothetical protein
MALTINIRVEGSVSVADLRTLVDSFAELIEALTAETVARDETKPTVLWLVDAMQGGSAEITTRGVSGDNRAADATIETVVALYDQVAADAEGGAIERYSGAIRYALGKMTSILKPSTPSLKMWARERPREIVASLEPDVEGDQWAAEAPPLVLQPRTRSSVRGKIVTLDQKRGLYFTLQEAHTRRNIRCYPDGRDKDSLGRYWSSGQYVTVEGTYVRYGQHPTLTDITDIVEHPILDRDAWRQAVGAAPPLKDGLKITSAEAVRRTRDGEG